MGAKICRSRAVAGSEPMICWKKYINGQNIKEERKERRQDNGLYTVY